MALAESAFHLALRVHQLVYVRSGGAVGHRLLGVPTLLLRTTGRRSGSTRTNALVYAQDGERRLVVPSNGGASRAPAWLHNLRAEPAVEVQVGRRSWPARATVIEPSDPDFGRLWKIVNDNNGDRYNAYQARTSRPIPVVVLTPVRDGAAGA